jgi:hypothetical protein
MRPVGAVAEPTFFTLLSRIGLRFLLVSGG